MSYLIIDNKVVATSPETYKARDCTAYFVGTTDRCPHSGKPAKISNAKKWEKSCVESIFALNEDGDAEVDKNQEPSEKQDNLLCCELISNSGEVLSKEYRFSKMSAVEMKTYLEKLFIPDEGSEYRVTKEKSLTK